MSETVQVITAAELARHNTRDDLWIAVHGKIYKLSSFANNHPGGVEILTECAGTDGSESYDYAGHSEGAKETLERFFVGTLQGHASSTGASTLAKVDQPPSTLESKSKGIPETSLMSPLGWIAILSICGLLALAKFLPEVVDLAPSMPRFQNATWPFWTGGLFLVSVTGIGAAVIHKEFGKTLEHTKEPFAYPAVIPRAIRLPH